MQKKEKLIIVLSCVFLFCVTFGVFSGVLDNEFLTGWDDAAYVLDNNFVNSGFSTKNLKRAFTESVVNNWHPVTMLSHMMDVELFGLNPKFHHFSNLLFHCGNTILVYLFLTITTKNKISALLVALLFGIHPLHVESVAWVAERKDLLSSFFILTALCVYPCYVGADKGNKKIGLFVIICFLHLLGLMSKAMVITFPFLLLIVDYWPLNRFEHDKFRVLLLEKTPLLFLSSLFVSLTFFTQMHKRFNMSDNIVTALYTYFHHILSFLAPVNLSFLYSYSLKPGYSTKILSVLSLIILGFLVCIALKKQYRFFISGLMIYVVLYFPVSGIVRIGKHLYADRYMYLPLLGLSIILVYAITTCFKKVTFTIPIFIIVLSLITYKYEKTWNSQITMVSNAVSLKTLDQSDYIVVNTYLVKYFYDKGGILSVKPYLHRSLIKEAFYNDNDISSMEKVSFYDQSDFIKMDLDIKLFKYHAFFYYSLARLYIVQGDYKNAIIVVNKGLSSFMNDKQLLEQKHFLNSVGYY